VPDLAASWTVNADGTIYTFILSPGMYWHNGVVMTFADVKLSFDEVLLNYHARITAGLGAVVERIDSPDDRTVVFRLKQPAGALLQKLDVTEALILPRHAFEAGILVRPGQQGAGRQRAVPP
jgi:peptide/nickel transport system substrate-binding protein